MFNSQKINTDPKPYIVDFGLALGETRSAEDCGSHWDSHDTRHEPRPEFDNNPNPILLEFRNASKSYHNLGLAIRHYREYLNNDVYDWRGMDEEKDHARKVLSRLENLDISTHEPDDPHYKEN